MSADAIDRPLLGYVVVEADYDDDRDEPIHSFVSSPFETREKAERERDKRIQAYREFCEEEGELYEEKDISVAELKIHNVDRLEPMDKDRHETMMGAVNAVGASLLADEGIGPVAGDKR